MRLGLVSLACLALLGACTDEGAGLGLGSHRASETTDSSETAPPADSANSASTKSENGKATEATSSAPSCAREHGGKTCGPKGTDDCCAIAPETKVSKYMVTAGRMRTFVEHFKGDIAGYVKTLPANKWKPEWNVPDAIPTDRASADVALGPAGKKACEQGAFTGHTFWTPKTDDDFSDFSQDALDEKALNCVPWELMQALCVWDGGHLATAEELKAAFTNNGTTKFPWGDDAAPTDQPDAEERLNIEGGFETAPLPATFRKRDDGKPAEVSFLIAPPGRFPKGNNKAGIADSAGNLLEYVGDAPRQFIWKGDFEHHGADAAAMNLGNIFMTQRNGFPIGLGFGAWIWGDGQLYGNAGNADQKNGYYSVGGRCSLSSK